MDVPTADATPPVGSPLLVPDAVLLAQFVAQGSDGAFSLLVERHRGMVFRTCLRVLGDPAAAEDALQAVFVVLARRARSVRGDSLGAWLHGVSVRTSRDWARRGRVRVRHEQAAARLAPSMADAPTAVDPQALDRALARLPDRLRQAVVLCHLEGRTQRDAAAIAQCPVGTMAWRVTEAMRRLRALLHLQEDGATGLLLALAAEAAAGHTAPPVPTAAVLGATGTAAGMSAGGVTALAVAAGLAAVAGGAWWRVHHVAPVPPAAHAAVAAATPGTPSLADIRLGPLALPAGVPLIGAHPTIASIADGDWSDPRVWTPARLPRTGDVVAVRHAVRYAGADDAALAVVAVWPGAQLTLVGMPATRLTVGTLVVQPGATLTGAASGPAASLALLLTGENTGDTPAAWRGGLLALGTVALAGSPRTAFVRLAREPHVGDTALVLATPPTGWAVGDELLLPDSREIDAAASVPDDAERVAIRGLSRDGTRVTLAQPLAHDHPGARDPDGLLRLLPHVANLTRAVTIRSAHPGGVQGFVWSGGDGRLALADVALEDLGQGRLAAADTAPGRAGIVLDHLRTTASPASIVGCVVRGPTAGRTARGILIDASDGVAIRDTIVDGWLGAGIATATGAEEGTRIAHCFISHVTGTGALGDDVGLAGYGLFLRGPAAAVEGNVIIQVDGGLYSSGLCIDARQAPAVEGPDGVRRDPNALPLGRVADNEIYACPTGMRLSWLGARYMTPLAPAGTIDATRIWHHRSWAVYASETNGLHLRHLTVLAEHALPNRPGGLRFYEVQRHLAIDQADIAGTAFGIALSPADEVTISDSTLRTSQDLQCDLMGTANGGQGLPPRTTILRNVHCVALPGQPHQSIVHVANLGPGHNCVQRDVLRVIAFNGRPGDDFQVYFDEQRPDAVLPLGSAQLVGAPVAGRTNAQAWAQWHLPFAGEIAPAGAHPRAGIVGLVAP